MSFRNASGITAIFFRMNRSFLVRLFGFPATMIHGDTTVLDRWLWLKNRLPIVQNEIRLLDVGCGTGSFSIGTGLRGYRSLGLSWDKRNQRVAQERARLCKATLSTFEILDVRRLDSRPDLVGVFDVLVCLETIEHILDDKKLMKDIAACLKPGGRLLLTTPYLYYRAITRGDDGPFLEVETGWHVRRGYTQESLASLCEYAGLNIVEVSYCSGFLSQKITFLQRTFSVVHPLLGWLVILPLRIMPPFLDPIVTKLLRWPYFSIAIDATKPP